MNSIERRIDRMERRHGGREFDWPAVFSEAFGQPVPQDRIEALFDDDRTWKIFDSRHVDSDWMDKFDSLAQEMFFGTRSEGS